MHYMTELAIVDKVIHMIMTNDMTELTIIYKVVPTSTNHDAKRMTEDS